MEMSGHKIVSPKIFDGLADTLNILHQSAEEELETGQKSAVFKAFQEVAGRIEQFQEKTKSSPACLSEIHTLLRQLSTDISKIFSQPDLKNYENAKKWARAFERQCYDFLEDMAFIAPWILLPPGMPGLCDGGGDIQQGQLTRLREALRHLDEIPSLGEAARLEQKLVPL